MTKSTMIVTPLEEKEKKKARAVMSILPVEMQENILVKLPVKSLLRFKFLCKLWYSCISDSKFPRVYLQHSMKLNRKSICLSFNISEFSHNCTLLRLTGQGFELESIKLPIEICSGVQECYCKALCCCEGLVVYGNRETQVYVLWNPSTNKYTQFSSPFDYVSYKCFGLCYDSSRDDYKLVYINRIDHLRYAVYSCKTDSWTEEKTCSLDGWWIRPTGGIFVNGALHWVMYKYFKNPLPDDSDGEDSDGDDSDGDDSDVNALAYQCDLNRRYEILCYDPIDDKFEILSKPASFDISSIFHLFELVGQLCVCRYTNNFAMVDIWTMKKYGDSASWTKLITIQNVPFKRNVPMKLTAHRLDDDLLIQLLGLTNDGSYVLEIDSDIVIYSPRNDEFDEVKIDKAILGSEYSRLCWNDSFLFPSLINNT